MSGQTVLSPSLLHPILLCMFVLAVSYLLCRFAGNITLCSHSACLVKWVEIRAAKAEHVASQLLLFGRSCNFSWKGETLKLLILFSFCDAACIYIWLVNLMFFETEAQYIYACQCRLTLPKRRKSSQSGLLLFFHRTTGDQFFSVPDPVQGRGGGGGEALQAIYFCSSNLQWHLHCLMLLYFHLGGEKQRCSRRSWVQHVTGIQKSGSCWGKPREMCLWIQYGF